jgi:1-acyl-sn-glycerol-3-phosphate acyltransferase
MLGKILRRIHLCIYVCWVVFFFILLYPSLWIACRKPQRNFSLILKIRRILATLSAFFSGFYFEFQFEEQIDWSKTYIICPNHTSILDISVIAILCKKDYSFMGKEELVNNPITRSFFKTVDISVNRNSKISSYKAFKLAQQRLKEKKNLVIFPEGGITDFYPPVLQEFKSGPFRLAIENKLPIMPVVIHNLWKLLWDEGRNGSRPGTCVIEVLKPIETTDLDISDVDALRQQVHNLFANRLNSSLKM